MGQHEGVRWPVVLSINPPQRVRESSSVEHGASQPPRWSVVVPAFNRPAQIKTCYAHLLRLEAPWGYEIVIVDDGSAPRLDLGPLPDHVRLIRTPNQRTARARNRGVAEATGKFIAFTDDDCAPAPDWLVQLDATMAGRTGVLAGGTTINGLTDNIFSETTQELVDFFEAWEARDGEPTFFAGMNIALARETFLALGGFPDIPGGAGEDRAFCDIFLRNGGRLVRSPAQVLHFHPLTARSFLQQHAFYGRGAPMVFRMRKMSGARSTVSDRKLKMLFELVRFPFTRHHPMKAARLCALLTATQAATAWGYAAARLSRNA